MSDKTKVPPGWVRLTVTGETTRDAIFAARHILCARDSGGSTRIDTVDQQGWTVSESPAEVATLIAEAEAAERRARALPVMAAILWGCEIASAERAGICTDEEMSVRNAAAILDAIERREGE